MFLQSKAFCNILGNEKSRASKECACLIKYDEVSAFYEDPYIQAKYQKEHTRRAQRVSNGAAGAMCFFYRWCRVRAAGAQLCDGR